MRSVFVSVPERERDNGKRTIAVRIDYWNDELLMQYIYTNVKINCCRQSIQLLTHLYETVHAHQLGEGM